MSSKERHHAAKLVPPYNDFFITGVSIETWDIASQKRKANNCGW